MVKFLTEEEIVRELMLEVANYDDIETFKETPYDRLSRYHLSFGMDIRNRYGLWHPLNPQTAEWAGLNESGKNEYLKNGVDYSPLHPDARSMRIIQMLWKELNG